MAPVKYAYPQVSSTYATMSSTAPSSTAFVSLTLGRSANAIELSVPPAPAVSAAGDLKARSFDFLADLLVSHSALYSSAELFAAFSGHIPTSSYNATLEVNNICNDLRSLVFYVDNLVPLGFRDHLGKSITASITADVSNRPSGICYFAFRSTTLPSAHDPRLSVPSHSFEFWLALPQTTPGSTSASLGTADTVRKHLTFDTPDKRSASASTKPLITLAELEAMPDTAIALLGTSVSTDTMTDYDADCFSILLPSQIKNLVIRSAAAVTAAAASLSVVSPRMSAVLASTTTSSSSYYGTLDFLDSQSEFEAVFPDPVPLLVTPTTAGAVSVDSITLLTQLLSFIDRCKFQLFVPIFRCDYVGTADRDDASSLHATIQALKRPSMAYRNPSSGHWINLTPDELFAEYAELTPLLPNNVSLWGLNLVTQFLNALSLDLQEALQTDPLYSAPDLSTLTSRSSQLGALRSLRVAAVRQFTLLRAQERLIAKTINRKLNKQSPGTTALAAPISASIIHPIQGSSTSPVGLSDHGSSLTRSFMSPAEQTMSRYQPTPPTNTADPLSNPIDPVTNFQSSYPINFIGCMFCGDPNHVFRSCPANGQPGASAVFYKNLFAHKPHLRKREPRPDEILPARPATQSFAAPAAGFVPPAPPSAAGLPSAISPPPSNASGASTNSALTSGSVIPPPPPNLLSPSPLPPKRARFFVQLVKTFQANLPAPTPPLPPMPIAIDNGLPHITFNLGSNPEQDPTLCGLMDTCGALNTGYLPFHLWMKSVRPDIVADFVSFDDSNPFEPIKLGGAIRDPKEFVSHDHGNLTAVIRYYTPYTDITGSPITLSFALGNDVTVNTIFGLPMLCDLDAVISLRSNSMHSRSLNCDFSITRIAANFGLPAGCSFDPAAASRNHASTLNLTPSAAAAASAFAAASSNTSTLATATDDMSLGFLQRTVHPLA
jgi:hypothetical protein